MKVVIFDVDGVLTVPEEVFSVVYARSRGIDVQPFRDFFQHQWLPIVTGKQDLKEHIISHPELWQWEGSPEELLDFWFKTEDVRNSVLLAIIIELKEKGFECYLATDQEKYRANYMKTAMFKDLFTDYFVSAELGVAKTDPKFFELMLKQLQNSHPDLKPSDVILFDDSQPKVSTAQSVGIDARLFTSNVQVRELIDSK